MVSVRIRRALVIKAVIGIGLVAVYVVPQQYGPAVAMVSNFVWLFWEETKA